MKPAYFLEILCFLQAAELNAKKPFDDSELHCHMEMPKCKTKENLFIEWLFPLRRLCIHGCSCNEKSNSLKNPYSHKMNTNISEYQNIVSFGGDCNLVHETESADGLLKGRYEFNWSAFCSILCDCVVRISYKRLPSNENYGIQYKNDEDEKNDCTPFCIGCSSTAATTSSATTTPSPATTPSSSTTPATTPSPSTTPSPASTIQHPVTTSTHVTSNALKTFVPTTSSSYCLSTGGLVGMSIGIFIFVTAVVLANLFYLKRSHICKRAVEYPDQSNNKPTNNVYSSVNKTNNGIETDFEEFRSGNEYEELDPNTNFQMSVNVIYNGFESVTNENETQSKNANAPDAVSSKRRDSNVYPKLDKKRVSAMVDVVQNDEFYQFAENDPTNDVTSDGTYNEVM